MDTNLMLGNLLFQTFAAILITFTVTATIVSWQAKLVELRVRAYIQNNKIEIPEE